MYPGAGYNGCWLEFYLVKNTCSCCSTQGCVHLELSTEDQATVHGPLHGPLRDPSSYYILLNVTCTWSKASIKLVIVNIMCIVYKHETVFNTSTNLVYKCDPGNTIVHSYFSNWVPRIKISINLNDFDNYC